MRIPLLFLVGDYQGSTPLARALSRKLTRAVGMFMSKRKHNPEFKREPIEMVRLLGASCLQVTLENGLFPHRSPAGLERHSQAQIKPS